MEYHDLSQKIEDENEFLLSKYCTEVIIPYSSIKCKNQGTLETRTLF